MHKQFLQILTGAFSYRLQLPTMADTSHFLLFAWNGSMLLFWSRSGKGTHSLFSFPLNGRDSLLLFWLALLFSPSPFLLGQIISSPTPFLPFAFLEKTFISPIPLVFSLRTKKILSPTSILQKYSKTIPNPVLATKSFQPRKNILSPIYSWLRKNPSFLLTHFLHLPPESKRCPLMLASVLTCADSVDELRFWNKSES